jgi:transmembrane sensor
VETVAPSQATAWESGRLTFDDEPLAVAVERVNRYGATPVRLGDARAAAHRVSGLFDAGDTAAFVEAVSQYFELDAAQGPGGEIVLHSRGENRP